MNRSADPLDPFSSRSQLGCPSFVGLTSQQSPRLRSQKLRSQKLRSQKLRSPKKRLSIHLPSIRILALLTLSVIPATLVSAHASLAAVAPPGWTESSIGTVPNSYGELFTVAGLPNKYTLVFRNTRREIRIVEVPGNKLPSSVLLIDRNPSTSSSKDSPSSGDQEKKGSGQLVEKGWKEEQVGSIPERFGALVNVSGGRGSYTLVFTDGDQRIRIVLWTGKSLSKETYLYTIAPAASNRADASLRNTQKRARQNQGEGPDQSAHADGWTDIEAGTIPEHFGDLLSTSSDGLRTTLTFQNPIGDITIFDVRPNQVPKTARVIFRSVPSKEELSGRNDDDKERKGLGFDWEINRLGVIPDAYGEFHSISGQSSLSLVFQDEEKQLRIVDLPVNKLKTEVSLIERPTATMKKAKTDAEGWLTTPIGAIPEEFGALRSVTGKSKFQQVFIFQAEAGEIRLIERTGLMLPNKLSRVDLAY